MAVIRNLPSVVRRLLAGGADPHGIDHGGDNLLTLGADVATPEVLRLLLEAGVDANHVTPDGRTALLVAVWNGDATPEQTADRVAVLLEHGADPRVADTGYGHTPRQWLEQQTEDLPPLDGCGPEGGHLVRREAIRLLAGAEARLA